MSTLRFRRAKKLSVAVVVTLALSGCTTDAPADPALGSAALDSSVDDMTVLVVGDSLAHALGEGMSAVTDSRNVTIVNAAIGGCGLLLPVQQRMNGKLSLTDEECNAWPTAWPELIETHEPDAVYLTTSFWDAAPQILTQEGDEGTLDDRRFQDRWVENAKRAIGILEARGATVYLDDLNPSQLHEVQRRAVEESSEHHVALLPLYQELCTARSCPSQIDRIRVLDDTGHPSGESRDRLARWILNQMAGDLDQ